MPPKSSLYGHKSDASTKPKPVSAASASSFAGALSLLINQPRPVKTRSSKEIPTKPRENLFARPAKKQKRDDAIAVTDSNGRKGFIQDIGGVDEAVLERSRRKMEKKAQLYKDLKKGYGAYADEHEHGNGLVDFDTKWTVGEAESSSSEDEASAPNPGELLEYTDEYGRLRTGTQAQQQQAAKEARLRSNIQAEEQAEQEARRPNNLIRGDTIQSFAFNPEEKVYTRMQDLARKRDRSLTPPEATHYDAKWEIRDRGVGFYAFSKDKEARGEAMENLKTDREATEAVRRAQAESGKLAAEGDDLLRKLEKEREVDDFLQNMEAKKHC